MNEQIYTSSTFWSFIAVSHELLNFFLPLFLILASSIWLYRQRCPESWLAFIGSVFSASNLGIHLFIHGVKAISLAHIQPTFEQNPIIFFFNFYGHTFGVVLFIVAVGIYFFRGSKRA